MNKVDSQHKMYGGLESKRDVFRAVKGGTDAIQAKGEMYLPRFPAEASTEYTARLKASTIDGIVQSGVDMLTGAVFYGDIDDSDVNAKILPLLENIDNKGNDLETFARMTFEAAFDGCALIVVDRPKAAMPVVSAEDERSLNIRTYWRLYYACDAVNWRYRVNPVSMATELELLVLSEMVDEVVNRFECKMVQKYRVYFLEGNTVGWELWRKDEQLTAKGESQFILEDGGTLPEYSAIPVAIVGCLDDEPRLLTESRLEIKAYQKESSFDVIEYLSVPVFYTIGYDGDDPISFGASTHVKMPSGSGNAVGFAQIDSAGHQSLKGTIEAIKAYIRSRLNDMVLEASAEKTATQSNIEDRDKQSRLIVWAEQFEDALEYALGFTSESMGMKFEDAGGIKLNAAWSDIKPVTPAQDLTAESNLVTEGLESLESFVEKRFAGGYLPEGVTVEMELARIKAEETAMAGIKPVMNAQQMPNGMTATNKTMVMGNETNTTAS